METVAAHNTSDLSCGEKHSKSYSLNLVYVTFLTQLVVSKALSELILKKLKTYIAMWTSGTFGGPLKVLVFDLFFILCRFAYTF